MTERKNAQIGSRHNVGICLLSLATLLLELALTRVLSVALWYHFGFLIVSTALLGFGTSGVLLALWHRLRETTKLDQTLAICAMLFGLLTLISFWLMQHIPFNPAKVFSDKRQYVLMPLYYLIASLPFFCSGLVLGLLFTRGSARMHRLYAFDLVGAGLGCGAIALVMPMFGGSGSVVVAAAIGLIAGAVFAIPHSSKLAWTCTALSVSALLAAGRADRFLPIAVTPVKVFFRNHQSIYTAWNTFSRIDVFEFPSDRETGAPSKRRIVFDAGTAGTSIQDLRPGVRQYLSQHKDDVDYRSGIAYFHKVHPKVLIIGSGAGAEVLDALHFGAREITAVEINPIVNDLVGNKMNAYWGGLFQEPEVHLVTDEGRSFVRRSTEHYDAIILVHTISNAAIASGALSLAENYVFTREALDDYLDHLTPDGVIYFNRPETQIPRLFTTGREALSARGILDFPHHFYAYRVPESGHYVRKWWVHRASFDAGFLLRKSPFTDEEINGINELLGAGLPAKDPYHPSTEVLYSPTDPHPGSIYQVLVNAPDLQSIYRATPTQIEPTTDDRPFFNHASRWSSINRRTFHDGTFFLQELPVAEITLLVLLVQAVVIAAVLILLPLARFSRAGMQVQNRYAFLVYFAALGFGFITIEIALLSQFTLFLGEPVYTFAVVLGSLLVFSGIGAGLSGRFGAQPRQALLWILPILLAAVLLTAFLIPALFRMALGLWLPSRVMLGVLALAPIGILLGMPFPTALRMVSSESSPLIPWAWGVNGFFTVIGTISAQMLAMTFGFRLVLLLGAACYFVAWAVIHGFQQAVQLTATTRAETIAPAL